MHTIRANLYWEFPFVLGYIAVPRSRILLEPLYGSGVVVKPETRPDGTHRRVCEVYSQR